MSLNFIKDKSYLYDISYDFEVTMDTSKSNDNFLWLTKNELDDYINKGLIDIKYKEKLNDNGN